MSGMPSSNSARVDLVGDIHGASARLLQLLSQLGYVKTGGRWSHSENARIVFLGDYADKGDDVGGGIELVRELCDHRVACAIAGNHDTNALAFCMRRDTGNFEPRAAQISGPAANPDESAWVRAHDSKNICQHSRTLQLEASVYAETIAWFATLPLWLEIPGLRAVHAAWIPQSIRKIRSLAARGASNAIDTTRPNIAWLEARSIDEAIELQHARVQAGGMSARDWRLLLDLGSVLDERTGEVGELEKPIKADESTPDRTHAVAFERVLKGVECPLGDDWFIDSENHRRAQVRIRWFDAAANRSVVDHALVPPTQRDELRAKIPTRSFAELAQKLAASGTELPPLARMIPLEAGDAYGVDEQPVFFGHYGFTPEDGSILLRNNVACLDTSAYDPKRGALTAYRWSGETMLQQHAIVIQR